jgi:uncharacterized OsmC-like protein
MSETGTGPHIETFRAHAKGTGWPTSVAIAESEWTFSVDEPVEDGGSNSGPNPMHHLVASLAGCQNEQAQVAAEELGFAANDINIDVEVDLNLDGFMGITNNSDGCFQGVRLNATVAGVSPEQAIELGKRVDARCPILSLLRSGGASIESVWAPK